MEREWLVADSMEERNEGMKWVNKYSMPQEEGKEESQIQ